MLRLVVLVVFCPLSVLAACASRTWGPTLGVDYYPEQWPLEEMKGDMRAIRQELGADMIRVGEFMWSIIEPSDGVFNFTLLDTIIDAAQAEGLCVMLGTPTATMPAWLYAAHQHDVVMTSPDSPEGYLGAPASFGGRRQYSFNSATYLRYVERMVTQLAMRYGPRDNVVTHWQVDNELGHEGSDLDFSDSCLSGWHQWLNVKYKGDINQLNSDWGTRFWGAEYTEISQIPLPKYTVPGTPPRPNEGFRSNMSPGMLVAFRRFRADSIAQFAGAQVRILRNYSSTQQITTNSPGGVWAKAIDHNLIFESMDVLAYDNYPVWGGSTAPTSPSEVAFALDMVRGWGQFESNHTSPRGFMISEQLIGAQGHDIVGYTPRPQQAVAWSAQTFSHGATSLMFFRYRAAVYGQEQFCYGILDHTMPIGTGRKWKEAKQVYRLARSHPGLWMQPIVAEVAVVYDMNNVFAWQAQPQSTAFFADVEAHRLYKPFWRAGVAIDVVSADRIVSGTIDMSHYRVLILPTPMLVNDKLLSLMSDWVQAGGSLWIGYRSDIKQHKTNQVRRSGSRLAHMAGVQVAEIESLNTPMSCVVREAGSPSAANVSATVWREGLEMTSNDTVALYEYTDSFFGALGYKAMTRRVLLSGGEVVYVGAGIDPTALEPAALQSLQRQKISHLAPSDPDVEQLIRLDDTGKVWYIRINYGSQAANVRTANGTLNMPPYGVSILPNVN